MITLYHGSVVAVRKVSLGKCRRRTDFGKGFYTTTSKDQAIKWAKLKKERSGASMGIVSVFEIDEAILADVNFAIMRFDGANVNWLETVVSNRRESGTNKHDIVIGPVANDNLYATITLYEQGVLSANAAIEQLKSHKLFDQLSFHTENAVAQLTYKESFDVE
ncbi:MAG: DUF3990 domain-containing protein [Bacteroidales bacterium]